MQHEHNSCHLLLQIFLQILLQSFHKIILFDYKVYFTFYVFIKSLLK